MSGLRGVALAQPPGCRSCGIVPLAVGEHHVWNDCSELANEGGRVAAFYESTADLDPHVRRILKVQFLRLLAAAQEGRLEYLPAGAGARPGTVSTMRVTDDLVLELRTQSKIRMGKSKLHGRFYFTEPDSYPGQLLALLATWKEPTPAGREQQNRDALEALRRFQVEIELSAAPG